MTPYQEYVLANERWFRGRPPESEQSLKHAESVLNISLPDDLKWVLKTYGYWHATGVCSLDSMVERTQAARVHLNLPHNWVVLYDHDEGGAFLLDTNTEEVVGLAWEDVPENLHADAVFPTLKQYAVHLIEENCLSEDDIDYDPEQYPDN